MKLRYSILALGICSAAASAARADLTILSYDIHGTVSTSIADLGLNTDYSDTESFIFPASTFADTTSPVITNPGSVYGSMTTTNTSIAISLGGYLTAFKGPDYPYQTVGTYTADALVHFHLTADSLVSLASSSGGLGVNGFAIYKTDADIPNGYLVSVWDGHKNDSIDLAAGDYVLHGIASSDYHAGNYQGVGLDESLTLSVPATDPQPAFVPEPASLAMLTIGAGSLLLRRRKR